MWGWQGKGWAGERRFTNALYQARMYLSQPRCFDEGWTSHNCAIPFSTVDLNLSLFVGAFSSRPRVYLMWTAEQLMHHSFVRVPPLQRESLTTQRRQTSTRTVKASTWAARKQLALLLGLLSYNQYFHVGCFMFTFAEFKIAALVDVAMPVVTSGNNNGAHCRQAIIRLFQSFCGCLWFVSMSLLTPGCTERYLGWESKVSSLLPAATRLTACCGWSPLFHDYWMYFKLVFLGNSEASPVAINAKL